MRNGITNAGAAMSQERLSVKRLTTSLVLVSRDGRVRVALNSTIAIFATVKTRECARITTAFASGDGMAITVGKVIATFATIRVRDNAVERLATFACARTDIPRLTVLSGHD